MKKKTWGWIIAIVVVIVLIAVAGGGESEAPEAESATAEASDTPKEWVELMTLTGSGSKKSAEFAYPGGKARLRYDFSANQFGSCAIYVVREGVDIMSDGGFPEVMLDSSEQGESNLSHLKKGNYYLNVISANGKWTVTVEVLR